MGSIIGVWSVQLIQAYPVVEGGVSRSFDEARPWFRPELGGGELQTVNTSDGDGRLKID